MSKCLPLDENCEDQAIDSYQNENLNCPCKSNCPDGCPCPNYECGSTTTTTPTTTTATTTTMMPSETKDRLIKRKPMLHCRKFITTDDKKPRQDFTFGPWNEANVLV